MIGMKRILFILFLFLPIVAGGWAANIKVLVLDSRDNPLENASVVIIYQKNACGVSTDKEYGYTDKNGIALIYVRNQAPDLCVDYGYTVSVSYAHASKSEKFEITPKNTTPFVKIKLPITTYKLIVKVQDYKGRALQNIEVYASCFQKNLTTNESGMVSYSLLSGTSCELSAKLGEFSASNSTTLNNDTLLTLTFYNYNNTLIVRTVDEKYRPLVGANVSITAPSISYSGLTDENGEIVFTGLKVNRVGVSAKYYKEVLPQRIVKLDKEVTTETLIFTLYPSDSGNKTPINDTNITNITNITSANITNITVDKNITGGWKFDFEKALMDIFYFISNVLIIIFSFLAFIVAFILLFVILTAIRKGRLMYSLKCLYLYIKSKLGK